MNRTAAYRVRRSALGLDDSSRRNRAEHDAAYRARRPVRPFVGCDGEGAGLDDLGRQNYLLFCMGERELFRDGARLETADILAFICDAPKEAIYVGFAFGYDVTMILRDLPLSQQKRLFEPRLIGPGHSPFVWYRDFDIEYLPKNYLKVRRVRRVLDAEGKEKRITIPGSTRVIYETFGFFQKSFLKIIGEFDIGSPSERALIAASKERRAEFTEMTATERSYCALECRMLAELMEKLRVYCDAAGIKPASWSGAGKLAKALHQKHGTMKRDEVDLLPQGVRDLANMAYYGGRFEITRTGHVNQRVWEYDINSAYPAAMRLLPCLKCGVWRPITKHEFKKLPSGALYLSHVRFKADNLKPGQWGRLGGLPVRSKEGHLFWPLEGGGTYWSVEIESAEKLGFKCERLGGWVYEKRCDHTPFDWVEELYNYRLSIGSQGPGFPIKLGTNALYGQLAQRVGNPRFRNMVWAGLITAHTRALLNSAIALAPGSIIMLATDGVYSTEPLDLPLGEKLGQWGCTEFNDLFIVQPGLYWSIDKRKKKSRGLSGSFFEASDENGRPRTEGFEHEWRRFQSGGGSAATDQLARPNSVGLSDRSFPCCSIPVPGFIGLKLALARNKPELAGRWVRDTRDISFDYRNKRSGHTASGSAIITAPKTGGRNLVSLPHRDFLAAGGAEPWEMSRLMLEEQPDYIDLSPPYQD